MHPLRSLLPCVLLMLAMVRPAWAEDYRIDPVHSAVVFFVSHDGYSDAVGRLRIVHGWFRFDPHDWAKARVQAEIALDSVDMGEHAWSRVVAGSDFLDAKRHPLARFDSTSVQATGTDTAIIYGQLTLRGRTEGVAFPVRFNKRAFTIYGLHTVAGFTGLATLDRTLWGMDAFSSVVGREVKVLLEIEGIADGDAERAFQRATAAEAAR